MYQDCQRIVNQCPVGRMKEHCMFVAVEIFILLLLMMVIVTALFTNVVHTDARAYPVNTINDYWIAFSWQVCLILFLFRFHNGSNK